MGAFYIFDILGLDSLRDDKTAVTIFAIVIIAAMTLICVLGTELSAHFQRFMIGAQVLAMLIFAAVAIIKVAAGDAPAAPPSIRSCPGSRPLPSTASTCSCSDC